MNKSCHIGQWIRQSSYCLSAGIVIHKNEYCQQGNQRITNPCRLIFILDRRHNILGEGFTLPLPQPIFIQQKVLDADVLNAFFVNPRFNVIFDHHNFFE